MSDSRLEKFIYAICSMDVTDLPVPLSRIEKLWNCLITGETPDFEPLSRNEKYLMAMLDRYDISNLPAPMSRGEKLLYKIAVGETDLSDVPEYLSRYEELLKYLIENGGISGGDFEYVLYTLNQSMYTLYTTAEKPVKSAILKGNTLVNLINSDISSKTISINTTGSRVMWELKYIYPLSVGKTYTLIFETENIIGDVTTKINFSYCQGRLSTKEYRIETIENKVITSFVVDSAYENTVNNCLFYFTSNTPSVDTSITIKNVMIIEGDYTNQDISYFTGIESVKMPVLTTVGKNLFDKAKAVKGKWVYSTGGIDITVDNFIYTLDNVKKTTSYVTNFPTITYWSEYDDNGNFIRRINSQTITLSDNCAKVICAISIPSTLADEKIDTLQIEQGTQPSSYEPYKSNILSTSEDVELRGIGDVKDELNLLTGEVTERIGEIVLDGSEEWYEYDFNNMELENTRLFYCVCPSDINGSNPTVINNRFASVNPNAGGLWDTDVVGFCNKPVNNNFRLRLLKSTANTIAELKEYLQSNPITVQYELATPVVKTVDLTVVDQDNQPTKLGTFENITHVSLESAGLIPEVEMEVATNLLEDTVFNLTNAFNTLYPTAAKPVVDGTLYGQTLVNNMCRASYRNNRDDIKPDSNGHFINDTGLVKNILPLPTTVFKTSTTYTIILILDEIYDGGLNETQTFVGTKTTLKLGVNKKVFTSPSTFDVYYTQHNTQINGNFKARYMILEGDYTNVDIPYFTGMQSVKAPGITMIGKNLFDGIIEFGGIHSGTGLDTTWISNFRTSFMRVPKNNTNFIFTFDYKGSQISGGYFVIIYYNKNKERISSQSFSNQQPFNFNQDAYYYRITQNITDNLDISDITNIRLEEGSVATSYEPYKSITLSTPSDLELRKVGDVQDEVNVMTGEVVENLFELSVNSETDLKAGINCHKQSIPNHTVTSRYAINIWEMFGIDVENGYGLSDKIPYEDGDADKFHFKIGAAPNICFIYVPISELKTDDDAGFIEWAKNKNLKMLLKLTTPTTKTVDLSIVNQDGNETKLRTFDETTHVLLQSEAGPNPSASLTVRTKIPSASSTSLLMDDISTNQQQLEATVDEQSNNVDATMIATTEIYEETL